LKPISRREWMLGAAAGAAGCTRRRSAAATDSITILYPYDDTVLGPFMDEPAQFLMFLPLVAWNSRGELEGRLAGAWEHSPDYRTWTIRLREGIRWHDGVPVTAYDIKFNLELRSRPEIWWWEPGSFHVKVIDDLTFALTQEKNLTQLVPGLSDRSVYYPKHWIEKLDPSKFYTWEFWSHPVGNGPYRYVRHVPKTMLHLEANPGYYRGRPGISNVILKCRGDADTAVTGMELMRGDVDAAAEVARTDALRMARDARFLIYNQVLDSDVTVLFWNHKHALFQNRNVRRALTLAINRRELFQLLNFPDNTPIVDGPFTSRQLQRGDFRNPIPYDPEQAGWLLDKAGWELRSRRGIRERDGRSFSFRVILGSQGGGIGTSEAAVYIQSQLQRIGIQMNIDLLESSGVFPRVATGDYEAAILRLAMEQYFMNSRFLPTAGYDSPRHRELLGRLEAAFDPALQDQLFTEITELFQQDVPATALYPMVLTTIASRRVRGLDHSPYQGDLTWCMDDLALEEQA